MTFVGMCRNWSQSLTKHSCATIYADPAAKVTVVSSAPRLVSGDRVSTKLSRGELVHKYYQLELTCAQRSEVIPSLVLLFEVQRLESQLETYEA